MKKNFCWIIIFIILLLHAPMFKTYADGTETKEYGEYQVIYSKASGDEIITFRLKDNDAKFIGEHALSTATISYWTKGYNISLEIAPNGKVSSLGNKVKRVNLKGNPKDEIIGDHVITTYNLEFNELVKSVQELLIQKHGSIETANAAMQEGVNIYLSNIFQVYKRTGGSGTFQPAEKDFISREFYNLEDILNNQSWGPRTQEVLPYYYNIKLFIKLKSFTYDVVFIDEVGNEIKQLAQGLPAFKEGDIEYILQDEANDEFVINEKTYEFAQKAVYSYDDGTVSSVNINGNRLTSIHKKDQNARLKIILKEIELAPTPIPVPPSADKSETRTPIVIDYMKPTLSGKIGADPRGSEQFDITEAIPTTEKIYGEVKTSEYLINAAFSKVEGKITYYVPISKDYHLTWTAKDIFTDEEKTMSKTVTIRDIATIERKYSYTSIDSLAYYQIDYAKLNNYAFDSNELIIYPKDYQIPKIEYKNYGNTDNHIIEPEQAKSGIILPSESISGTDTIPSISSIDYSSIADSIIPQIQVKNDLLIFGGSKLLDDSIKEINTAELLQNSFKKPGLTDKNILYSSGNIIEAGKNNGIFNSSGTIVYKQLIGYNTSKGSRQTFIITDLNPVTIHTPVYCQGELLNDNKKYVQLINPDNNCVPVVLDTESNSSDFIVQISNYGYHTPYKGYGTRDYSKYVLKNEVIFPFDVYIDNKNDKNDSNDILIKANTWYTITGNQRFHVPMWVKENIYTARFRTIAVNGNGKESSIQNEANINKNNYAAAYNIGVQVSGKVYGLTLYDINDDMWKPVFRVYQSLNLKRNYLNIAGIGGADGTLSGQIYNKNSIYYYTVGTNNQNGIATNRNKKYTLPLINGSHPFEINQGMLKAGYVWRFQINTTGSEMMSDSSYIKIIPSFFYVGKDGKNREEVDIYYSARINGIYKSLVKVGSELDTTNIKITITGDKDLAIPEDELKITASIRNKPYLEWISQKNVMYTYGEVHTKNLFKTFSNSVYTGLIRNRSSGIELPVTENEITSKKQSYYFNYSLPNTFKAVSKSLDIESYLKKGITYKESFWKRDGYIIINFNIICYDRNGNAYLSYLNETNYLDNGNCCMWLMEGGQSKKTDYYGNTFEFKAGDSIMIYTDKTNINDYITGGIY